MHPHRFKEVNLRKSPSGADLSLAGLHPRRARKRPCASKKEKKRKRNDQGDVLLCVSDWQPRQRAESLKFVPLHLCLRLRTLVSTSSPLRHHLNNLPSPRFIVPSGRRQSGAWLGATRQEGLGCPSVRSACAHCPPLGEWGGGGRWSLF